MAKSQDKTDTTPVSDLTAKQAAAEHARLTQEILVHDKRYYQQDAPTISDADYDELRRRYNAIEERFPDLRTLESLSLKVGAAPTGRFRKVRHAVPMLSLDNAFSETRNGCCRSDPSYSGRWSGKRHAPIAADTKATRSGAGTSPNHGCSTAPHNC